MTRDDVIRVALDVGLTRLSLIDVGYLQHFAILVAEAEREECAKVCDSKVAAEYATGKVDHNEIGWTQACAAAIRARGEA